MKTKTNENNIIDDRMDATVTINMALSCVFCAQAFNLCREWVRAGFNPADTILSQDSIVIQDGLGGWYRHTVNMAVSAILHSAACKGNDGTKKAMVDPRSGDFDHARLLEKLFDKSISEHKSPYSDDRIAENARFVFSMLEMGPGSISGAVNDYLAALKANGSRRLVEGAHGSLIYSKSYRSGRAALLAGILEDVLEVWDGLFEAGVAESVDLSIAEVIDCRGRCMSKAVDRTVAYLNKIGGGCEDLVDRTLWSCGAGTWRGVSVSGGGLIPRLRDKLKEYSLRNVQAATRDCVTDYVNNRADKGKLRAFLDNNWEYIKKVFKVLNDI